jgi:hypothetical protein
MMAIDKSYIMSSVTDQCDKKTILAYMMPFHTLIEILKNLTNVGFSEVIPYGTSRWVQVENIRKPENPE